MFKPTKTANIKDYFAALPPERKEPMEFLHNFIQKAGPNLKPNFYYNMPGYGSFKSRNYKKEMIDWPIVSLASQKNYISIYVCAIKDKTYIAELYKSKLGKVNVGKSCIRFKKVEDINLDTLDEVIKYAEKNPGLIQK